MSMQQERRTGDVAWDARARVAAACRRLPCGLDAADRPDGEAVRQILAAFAEAGLLDLDFLTADGDRLTPDDMRRLAAALEALGAVSGTLASVYMVNAAMAGAALVLGASAEQKARLLPALRRGELQFAFALTEPEAGSDAANLATTATPDGQGFSLTGEKIYITGAATADWLIVAARSGAAKRAFSLFLVPGDAAGLTVEPLAKLAGGLHASCRVTLDDVRVAPSQLLGGPERQDQAWSTLRATGTLERLVVAAMAHGLADAVLCRALDFARRRRQFGQVIATFQGLQHTLVEMRLAVTAMRLFLAEALASLDRDPDPTEAICMAKHVCAERLQAVVQSGVRVMGGRSYFEFEEMSRCYREAPFSLFAGGTLEVQKMLIARAMGLVEPPPAAAGGSDR